MVEDLFEYIRKFNEQLEKVMEPKLFDWPADAFRDFDHIKIMLNKIEDNIKDKTKPPSIDDVKRIYTVLFRILRPRESKKLGIVLNYNDAQYIMIQGIIESALKTFEPYIKTLVHSLETPENKEIVNNLGVLKKEMWPTIPPRGAIYRRSK